MEHSWKHWLPQHIHGPLCTPTAGLYTRFTTSPRYNSPSFFFWAFFLAPFASKFTKAIHSNKHDRSWSGSERQPLTFHFFSLFLILQWSKVVSVEPQDKSMLLPCIRLHTLSSKTTRLFLGDSKAKLVTVLSCTSSEHNWFRIPGKPSVLYRGDFYRGAKLNDKICVCFIWLKVIWLRPPCAECVPLSTSLVPP